MKYNEIENNYIEAEIKEHYQFANALEVKEALGYDFRTIKGFKELSLKDKTLAESLICDFLDGFGLESREKLRLTKITREFKKFTLYYGQKYSYLYDSGSVG